jgi:hypothetical protein
LELVVIVPIDESDGQAFLAEPLRTGDSRETAAEDYHI